MTALIRRKMEYTGLYALDRAIISISINNLRRTYSISTGFCLQECAKAKRMENLACCLEQIKK